MDAWLTTHIAGDVLGADLTADLDTDPFEAAVEAARSYVEDRRPDLVDDDGEFVPTPAVRYGAALLSLRWYQRRAAVAGASGGDSGAVADVLADDPDLRRMLGVSSGGVIFGAPTLPVDATSGV